MNLSIKTLYLLLTKVLTIYSLNDLKVMDEDSLPHHGKCQPITVPFCMGIQYNETIMPNILNHKTQEQAGLEVHTFFPLVKVKCSPDIQLFLCAVYTPLCTVVEYPIPPCKSLCLSAKNGCEPLMANFGFLWPPELDCARFPDPPLCFGNSSTTIPTERVPTQSILSGFQPVNFQPSVHGIYNTHTRPAISSSARDYGFVCPLQFQVPKNLGYSVKFINKVEKDCGFPCNQMFFNETQRRYSKIWIGIWAIICTVSCLFTVLTFLIDKHRFRYPERPIIFLSVCYLMVSMAYVIGFIYDDSISCRPPFPTPIKLEGFNFDDMVSTITQGTKVESCTILFMILYFFGMASSVWWVILALTWFLAAGLKWGHEAIEANSQYFHLFAWAIPAIKTVTILAMDKVEGDVLSGVCYVGIWNMDTLRIFVLAPLFIYLVLGTVFLSFGFVSLFRIRTVMKLDGTKTDKLEKLMFRIGIFSLLYTLPAICVIACLYYEQANFDHWMHTWQLEMCQNPTYSIPCPLNKPSSNEFHSSVFGINNFWGENEQRTNNEPITTPLKPSKPRIEFFMIKYFMYMIVGITSTVWIWSSKTLNSWKRFGDRLQGASVTQGGRQVQSYV